MTEKEKALIRYKNTDLKYGSLIEEMILSGNHRQIILNKTNLKATYFTRFLLWKSHELVFRLKQNSIRVNRENALKNSILGAEKSRGKERKQITKEAIDLFLLLKEKEICLEHIIKEMRKIGFSDKKVLQLCKVYGKPKRFSFKGKNNPMFGISPGDGAGIGSKGWVVHGEKSFFFRSSLEMKVFMHMIENNIQFSISKHRILFKDQENNIKTYVPDIVIGNTLFEIKPKKLISTEINQIKFNALREYCNLWKLNCQFLTEDYFNFEKYTKEYLLECINLGIIVPLNDKEKNRLIRNAKRRK